MSHSLVWNLVDDSDPRINYSRGKWTTASGDTIPAAYTNSLDTSSTAGDVFNNTLHASKGVGSEFSFRYNGTGLVLVYGTLVIPSITEESSGGYARIDCLLDGQQRLGGGIAWPVNVPTLGNNQPICQLTESSIASSITFEGTQGPLSPSEHELVVKVHLLDNNSTFYLDYLVYEPLPDAWLDGGGDGDGGVLQIGNAETELAPTIASDGDHRFELGSGWQTGPFGENFNTTVPGSMVTVRFNGTEIQLYGDLSGTSSNTATYQLDDEEPKLLQLVPQSRSGQAFTKQQFFNLSSLSSTEEHTLVVKHNGTADGMPLSFNYFLVTSLTVAERAARTENSNSSLTPSASDAPSSNHSKPLGAIIGGTVGSIVALAVFAIVAFVFIKRHRTRRRLTAHSFDVPTPYSDSSPSSPRPMMATAPTSPTVHAHLTSKTSSKRAELVTMLAERNHDLHENRGEGELEPGSEDDMVQRMRLENLKLQQRLAVSTSGSGGGRDLDARVDVSLVDVPEQNPSVPPVIHTDSGWRMGPGQREIPPSYTEA
ncbi:hypothetical protein D9758_013735 [Tetrapyrgos nigripes]|uniref:Uncharacterized protein n=1 Tax=Tetrapyrgos nigripes TaxID=182062 RepID=A0A8H5G1M9_9AGAR|nr:hypothetical protein D9758_013735 [Tetrapyrgos nigripes]